MSSIETQAAKQLSQQDDAIYKLMPSPAVRGGPFRIPRPLSVDLSPSSKVAASPLPMGPPPPNACDLQQVPQLLPRSTPEVVTPTATPVMAPPMGPPPVFTLQSSVLSKYNVREEGDPIKRLIREGVEFKDDRKQLKLLLRKRKSGNFESMSRDSLSSSAEEDSADDEDTKDEALYDDARLIHPANEPNVNVAMDKLNARFHKNMTSEQVEQQCAREDIGSIVPTMTLLDGYCGPHFPARDGPRLTREQLLPATPCVSIQTPDQALGPKLKKFCTSYPITVVRNICQVLEIDLGLFSTKMLAQSNPEHPIEVRTQFQQSCEENWDADKARQVWRCESHRSHTTVSRYAQYQAGTFVESLKGELKEHEDLKITASSPNSGATPEHLSDSDSNSGFGPSGAPKQKRQKRTSSFKTIKFGTNLDLSDRKKWAAQLKELEKLPAFTRVVDEANMLSHVGHTILGMNTVQLYMKVPGSRTPGHQENNNFCSVNINIGPGDCEWFGVDDAYWGDIHALCEKNGTSYLFGSWWPLQDDLIAANIPVYRFTQKPGDMVFVNAGCVHWVQASGWCNNIAWNIGPFNYDQFRLGVERYEWNKMQGFKSIVPMLHLAWNLARNVQFVNLKQADKAELNKLTDGNESLMNKVLQLQDLGDKATENDRQRRIRNVQPVDERMFDIMRTCLMRSLRSVERQRRFVRRLGKDIIFHGRNDDEVTYYCNTCDVEVFNVLFVKEIDKKHMVHCIECALKLNKTLKNVVVLEEFTHEELQQVYDKFVLKKISDLPEA
ncbi:histone demethylase UTY-like [Varroa destructor]|uniref:JmjC domain-containing protein n=1 Tax=Varroa destructor TaxID=109461 RepID=A0A7M7K489_VARDE|nr:histone demethylase UTY-like [Varroa destructor]XP_022661423.1 histone demethylase UTY-like [Varroa destructor]XP_022661424.1 histone demethylase UTY-like [Varroa destructor]XP_022661425.1 histone demethylase UTY-like [Varroa destructor]XP_022661426.1 histone demethylase UTY-like [Varroa destructor]XP_022661427.1 histone demethylase UTY-like [Varroa destructor]XP_022661428.1 histone demethylase UTY-like [Varroa destructor]XP_022661429.1 histone demethylase UTY-like [Varroa destructor]